MDDLNNINREGESQDTSSENQPTVQSGYTVTPEGGFYTKAKSEIIQDEVPTKPQEPEKAEQTQQNFNSYTQGTGSTQNSFNNSGYNPYGAPYGYKPPKVKNPKTPRKYGAGVIITAAILAAVIGCLGGAATTFLLADKNETVVVEKPEDGSTNVNINIDETAESVVEAVAVKVTPSVVGIRTTTSVISFFGGSSEATGEGSGVVYKADGYIITNYHVIADAIANQSASKIEVFVDAKGSKSYPATVVGYNISSDLAVIKIDAKGLAAAEIANSDDLKVGQYVITVGNPGGLEFMDSVTYGVISGLNRVVSSNSEIELIQTDAAINPGNSGGALVNAKGQLVGINSSKIVSEEYEGMGFAIPVNTVVKICDNIISKENSPEPYIGISISEKYTSSVLEYYGYPTGAVILSVADGSPAANAGIRRGDIITEYKGTGIDEYQVLEQLMEKSVPGENVTVKLYRSGRYYSTTITVGSNNQVD